MKRNKVLQITCNIDVILACVALVALISITFFGVIMRYCFGNPFVWQEEVQLALIIWVVFFGGRIAFVMGNHAAIDVVYEVFPKKLQKITTVFITVVSSIILVYVAYQGYQYLMQMYTSNRMTNLLKIPYVWIYAPLPISCVTMAIQMIINTFKDLTGKIREEER